MGQVESHEALGAGRMLEGSISKTFETRCRQRGSDDRADVAGEAALSRHIHPAVKSADIPVSSDPQSTANYGDKPPPVTKGAAIPPYSPKCRTSRAATVGNGRTTVSRAF